MSITHTTIRIDSDTRVRLRALAELINQPTAEVVRLLSYGNLSTTLDCTAAKAVAEQPKGGSSAGG